MPSVPFSLRPRAQRTGSRAARDRVRWNEALGAVNGVAFKQEVPRARRAERAFPLTRAGQESETILEP